MRKPTATALRRVHRWLENPLLPGQRRRAAVLRLHAADLSATRIGQLLPGHPNTGSADRHDFTRRRLSCRDGPRPVGAPSRLSRAQSATIGRRAGQPPTAVGWPYGRGSLAQLRAYLIRPRVLKAISRVHLRRVLKRGDTAVATSAANAFAPIPTGR